MFSTTGVWTVFSCPMEMQKNSYLSCMIFHCKSAPHCNTMLLNKVLKEYIQKEGKKQMNKTSHSKIDHCPPQHCLCVLARDTGWQGLQGLSTLDMFPVRHQMKLKGKSSLEFLSNCNARNINFKGNSYSYIP